MVEGRDFGSMMEWQSVRSSEGSHIASNVASMLQVYLLILCLQMLYLIGFLPFSDKILRLEYLRLGKSSALLSSQIHTLAAARAVAIASTEIKVNILFKAGGPLYSWNAFLERLFL